MPEGETKCGGDSSCQFRSVIEFAFADMVQDYKHAGARRRDMFDFVAERQQIAHLEEGTKVGTREAAAMQRMDQDKSANKGMEMATMAAAMNAKA